MSREYVYIIIYIYVMYSSNIQEQKTMLPCIGVWMYCLSVTLGMR